jgi:hypothetical protein
VNNVLRHISLLSHSSSKQVLFLGWFSCKNLLEKKISGEWNAQLVVAPLFETIPDLEVMSNLNTCPLSIFIADTNHCS